MGHIITTRSQNDIPLILLDEVEAVHWRRTPNKKINAALQQFDINQINRGRATAADRAGNYIDSKRFFLDETEDGADYPSLKPVWTDRNMLQQIFTDAVRGDVDMTHLFVQQAIRPGQYDNIFHQDYATGFKDKAARRDNETVFFTVAHKGFGTEGIPLADAGDSTAYLEDRRFVFYKPRTLSRLFAASTHDVLVLKSGADGTVHRAPQKGQGWRWWSFYLAGKNIHSIREKFSPQEIRELQARLPAHP